MSCKPASTKLIVLIMYFAPMLVITALLVAVSIFARPISCLAEQPTMCSDGRLCPALTQCCDTGCCTLPGVTTAITAIPQYGVEHADIQQMWYTQWPVLFLLGTLSAILLCCVWCLVVRRDERHVASSWWCSLTCCGRRGLSDHDSAGSVYPPPRYSRCGSIHQPPPPYSEVTSKPDLYPLVITCGEGDGKAGGNYLMVHYFRNYVIRAPGSLSATSTAESLSSSFTCNAANEVLEVLAQPSDRFPIWCRQNISAANSIIPPPYAYASNYEECVGIGCGRSLLRSLSSLTEPRDPLPRRRATPPRRGAAPRESVVTSPLQPLDSAFDLELELIDCEMYCDGGCKPRLGSSPPVHRSPSNLDDSLYERETYALRHLYTGPSPEGPGACESPPQPTSPTQTSGDSTLRRPSDERRHQRLDSLLRTPKSRKSSLYMPLSVAYPVRPSRTSPGARASSRSAPATPCGSLVPNLLSFTQRVSSSRHSSRSSRFEEESDPLLMDLELSRTDHKF